MSDGGWKNIVIQALPHHNQLVCKVTLLWQQMVDKLVLAKSLPGSPPAPGIISPPLTGYNIWGRVQAGNTWPGKCSNKEQNCQDVSQVSRVLITSSRVFYSQKLWRGSGVGYQGEADSFFISLCVSFQQQFANTSLSQINYNAFHLLIFIFKFLITQFHIYFTL